MTDFERDGDVDTSVVVQISRRRGEPGWMLDLRLDALRRFGEQSMAEWSASGFSDIDVHDAFVHLPSAVQRPQIGGVAAEHEYETVPQDRPDLDAQGVLFCDMDRALREYPQLVEQYFGTIVASDENKFAALNTAVWSGGSFIYVPPGVVVEMPLQAERRSVGQDVGQFARTLLIADTGSAVHFISGCSAPVYTRDALQAAVVEIVVEADARVTYTTIQNWSPNVYNIDTERARVEAGGRIEWIDGNIGSKSTMKCPEVHLVGDGATGAFLSVSCASKNQHQDVGARMVHAAPDTTSRMISRSIAKDGAVATFRSVVDVEEGATGAVSHVDAHALLLDEESVATTIPSIEIGEDDARISHEATQSRVSDEQRFHLMARGLSDEQAVGLIVGGFIEPITAALPIEYAVEWSRLVELHMEGSVG